MSSTFIGEQPLYGHIGHLLVIVAFVASIVSAISYLYSTHTENISWKAFARGAFAVHSACILSIFGLLIYLILSHRYEYYYVWQHSNNLMPLRYIFSCLWEGQEGSFLLWMMWMVVMSWVIIWRGGEWESGVVMWVSLIQIFLSSMLLGVVIFEIKIGSNPFVLLRLHPDFANLPFTSKPDYLLHLPPGRGLNPLLQNYWMTIHPPTLFLGFASTAIPFAFAMTGLIRKKYSEWIVPALPWTFFSIMILGTGILMGAAWAYESLSFGGFWAWDPVENASLVPWLTLVGAGHVMMIYKSRQQSLVSVYLLCILTFFLILYSTFLTRSGILGDSSVHAFTNEGMEVQLLSFMFFFGAIAIYLFLRNRKHLVTPTTEEHLSSREFWMFIGMLVLLIGAMQIIFTTSIPVFNKVFNQKIAPPPDLIDHYNRWQVPVAIIVCLLIGIGQFFKFKQTEMKGFYRRIIPPAIVALLVTLGAAFILGQYRIHYYILFFAACFAVLANLDFMLLTVRGQFKHPGASIAHVGIALIIMGALISNSKKQVISENTQWYNPVKDLPNKENIMVMQGSDTLKMGDYFVTYKGHEQQGVNIFYTVEYFKANPETGIKEKAFELKPVVQLNERMGNVAEPATKRFFNKDIYTHIQYASDIDDKKQESTNDEYREPETHKLAKGDTFLTSNSFVIYEGLDRNPDKSSLGFTSDSDVAVGALLRVEDVNRKQYEAVPVLYFKNLRAGFREAVVDPLGLKFYFVNIDPATSKIEIAASEKKTNKHDFIIMKAIIFPGINILWIGCILMILGSLLAIRKRILKQRKFV